MDTPQAVAMAAERSVLAVKKEISQKRVLCCLDHDLVSQKSLEMITQMATLFNADLEITGLTKKYELKQNVQETLDWLLKYYISKNIQYVMVISEHLIHLTLQLFYKNLSPKVYTYNATLIAKGRFFRGDALLKMTYPYKYLA